MRDCKAAIPIAALVAVLAAGPLPGCVSDPVSGERRFSVVDWTPEQERELGREAAPNVESQFDARYPGREANEALGVVVRDMAAKSPRAADFDFHFKVLNSSVPNAFALPGGYVYVTRGLLELMETEAQFVSVMGHELGHVEHQHAMYNMSRGTIGGVLTAPIRGAAALTRGLPGGGVVGLASGLAVAPLAIWGLQYSRSQELEADQRGVWFAVEMGYDPRDGEKTFATFQRLEDEAEGSGPPGWLRTHPLNQDRIDNIRQIIDGEHPEISGREASSFRQSSAAFKGVFSRFRERAKTHEKVDAAIVLIADPETSASAFAEALKTIEQASAKLPEQPLFRIALGEAALVRKEPAEAVTHFEAALAIYRRTFPEDSHWKAHLYLGVLALESDDAKKAIPQLATCTKRFPVLPVAHYYLGVAHERAGDADAALAAFQKAMDLSPSGSEVHRAARDGRGRVSSSR